MKALLRRVPWWLWVLAPGGLVIALYARSKRAPAPAQSRTRAADLYDVQSHTLTLVENAKAQAETLQRELAGNPLAARLVGVDPSLVESTPAKVAADGVEAEGIRHEIDVAQGEINKARAGWAADHYGGQTDGQFAAIMQGLQATLAGWVAKLQGLFA